MGIREYNITLKNNWNEITISDYFKLKGVTDTYGMVEILTDKTKEEIMEMDMETISAIMEEVSFIESEPESDPSLLNNEFSFLTDSNEKHTYRLNLQIDKWSAGRFEDAREYGATSVEDTEENLHLVIAIIMDKVEKERKWFKTTEKVIPYKDRDLLKEAELIYENFPISYAITCVSFFLTIMENIVGTTVSYSALEKRMVNSMMKIPQMMTT